MTIAAYNLGFSYLKEAREKTRKTNANTDTWIEVSKALKLMAKQEKDPSMVVRINEALVYVQKVQLYYRTLSVSKRSSFI